MTIQATHGQILVDVLAELQALLADLASTQRSPPPPSFDDEPKLPFDNLSQKGEYILCMEIGGVFVLEYIDYIKELFDVFHFILAHDIFFGDAFQFYGLYMLGGDSMFYVSFIVSCF